MHRSSQPGGFSLVEIAASIALLAFAFTALFGLLPTGMNTYRSAIDAANQLSIVQDIHSMVQVTAWSEVRDLADPQEGDIYYYDEQARRVDSELRPHSNASRRAERIYAVKLVADSLERPSSTMREVIPDSLRISAIFCPVLNAPAMEQFRSIRLPGDVQSLPRSSPVRARAFLVARMDSAGVP